MGRKFDKDAAKLKKSQPMSKTKLKKKESQLIFPKINDGTEVRLHKLTHRQKQRMVKRKVQQEKQQKKKDKIEQDKIVAIEREQYSDGELDSDGEINKLDQNGDNEEQHEMEHDGEGEEEEEEETDARSDITEDFVGSDDDTFDEQPEVANLFESDDDNDGNDKLQMDSDEDDSEGWSEAEREADELEGRNIATAAAKEDDEEGAIPALKQVLKEILEMPNIKVSLSRANAVMQVMEDFRNRRVVGRTRTEYLEILKADLCLCFSYNKFLLEKFMDLFSLPELMEFLEHNENSRPVTIRTNTLKVRRKQLTDSLNNRGVNAVPMKWSKVGLTVYDKPDSIALGATPDYLAGHYILQGASSLLPVMALAPKKNEHILDMCAAPGGKSTHIAGMMKNTGVLYCNDVHPDRVKALTANIHRMGITNTIVSCMDGRKLAKKLASSLDRVLVDAPCTGTGIISKDERVKLSKSEMDVQRCAHLQVDLLLAAIDAVTADSETGGYVVYSTCSVLVEENEQVVNNVLQKRHVKLVPTGLDIGAKGFTSYKKHRYHPSLELMQRIYPHKNNMDGFCIAKLKVISNKKITNSAVNGEIQ